MTKPTYTCDQCGAEKREANHWLALRTPASIATTPSTHHASTANYILPTLQILSFVDSGPSDEHICGMVCLIRRVTAFEEQLRRAAEELENENEYDRLSDLAAAKS